MYACVTLIHSYPHLHTNNTRTAAVEWGGINEMEEKGKERRTKWNWMRRRNRRVNIQNRKVYSFEKWILISEKVSFYFYRARLPITIIYFIRLTFEARERLHTVAHLCETCTNAAKRRRKVNNIRKTKHSLELWVKRKEKSEQPMWFRVGAIFWSVHFGLDWRLIRLRKNKPTIRIDSK